jgi:hypothetical protein
VWFYDIHSLIFLPFVAFFLLFFFSSIGGVVVLFNLYIRSFGIYFSFVYLFFGGRECSFLLPAIFLLVSARLFADFFFLEIGDWYIPFFVLSLLLFDN